MCCIQASENNKGRTQCGLFTFRGFCSTVLLKDPRLREECRAIAKLASLAGRSQGLAGVKEHLWWGEAPEQPNGSIEATKCPRLGDVARPTYAPSRGPARNPGSAPLKALSTVSKSFGSLP